MSNLTIVHANQLVDASYHFSLIEMRVLALASTKIDSRKNKVGEIRIDVSEYDRAYGITNNRSYGDLRDAVKSIMRKPVKLSDGSKIRELSWLVMNEYEADDCGSHVLIEFSPKIEPYLFDLKERFTSISFEYAARLNTAFSFRLYQWLKKVQHLNSHKKNGAVEVIFSIDWMKEQAKIKGEHSRWGHFHDRVIKPAVDKINAETDISVFYEPVKSGRKVSAVQFNYVVEKDESCMKPLRPRLFRRPKVLKDSHEEGVWMRKNLAILLEYEVQLKRYDKKEKLALADLRKIAEYASICDKITENRVKNEIELRTKK
ncbi:putative replication initiation protein (plasmid) [Aliivibrio wodanis]|uniref:Putative replication initiation protein n=1 Tax=Aliivibrio wodanis TaxID=80852 RepID=A0A090I8Q9_9GAMM|nr:putative replication initiation protein [Aliivibrio wodanis]